jgi:hypothetical protein
MLHADLNMDIHGAFITMLPSYLKCTWQGQVSPQSCHVDPQGWLSRELPILEVLFATQ